MKAQKCRLVIYIDSRIITVTVRMHTNVGRDRRTAPSSVLRIDRHQEKGEHRDCGRMKRVEYVFRKASHQDLYFGLPFSHYI